MSPVSLQWTLRCLGLLMRNHFHKLFLLSWWVYMGASSVSFPVLRRDENQPHVFYRKGRKGRSNSKLHEAEGIDCNQQIQLHCRGHLIFYLDLCCIRIVKKITIWGRERLQLPLIWIVSSHKQNHELLSGNLYCCCLNVCDPDCRENQKATPPAWRQQWH